MSELTKFEQIIALGPFLSSGSLAYKSFLVDLRGHHAIIDLPDFKHADAWIVDIEKIRPIAEIDYLILQTANLSQCGVIDKLVAHGFTGTLLTTYFFVRPLLDMFPPLKVATIDDLGRQLSFEGRLALKFIPMAFLPQPQMFMTYHVTSGVLFSATLFGSFDTSLIASAEAQARSFFDFHKQTMPSSEYLKEPLRKIIHLPLQAIYPSFGRRYEGAEVPPVIERAFKLDFYNTRSVFVYNATGGKDFNYLEIANHVIVTLLKSYDKERVKSLFADGPVTLNDLTMEIKESPFSGYALYNELFKHLYAKEGSSILALLEPLASMYQNQYALERPALYQSKMVEIQQELKAVEEEKRVLRQKIAALEREVKQAGASSQKDPITGLYNERYYIDVMKADLESESTPPYVRGWIMIRLDQLMVINQKYGKTTGDESLRHLAYLLNQIKRPDDVAIKMNGPDLLLYQKETTTERLLADAIKIRNAVAESKLFIEKMTISSAILSSDELLDVPAGDERVRVGRQRIEARLKTAIQKGQGTIGDRHAKDEVLFDGLILLIDEDDINRNMLTRIFASIKYEVITARDVIEAMLLLDKRPIDIIISEINLTKIDGFAFKQKLNETKAYAQIPFIIVSHSKTVANIRRANLLEIDLMLEKPVIPEELIGHVKRLKARRPGTP